MDDLLIPQSYSECDCILAIDPGTTESAYCIIDKLSYHIHDFGKIENHEMCRLVYDMFQSDLVIEGMQSYGMPVGKETFETCIWIGRFLEAHNLHKLVAYGIQGTQSIIYRSQVKVNICNSTKANDKTIRAALIDRFAQHDYKSGKGTKACPDVFYGFRADIWSAYAIGVTYLDEKREEAYV
jgi:hypothetical protein